MKTLRQEIEEIKELFEANCLDGDKVQDGQMIASTEVLRFLQEDAIPFILSAIAKRDKEERNKIRRDIEDKCFFLFPNLNWTSHQTQERIKEKIEEYFDSLK